METENIQLTLTLLFFSKLKKAYDSDVTHDVKRLEMVTHILSITRKKMLNKLKISDFPWIQQRSEVSESTTTTKSRDTNESRVTAEICLSETIAPGQNLQWIWKVRHQAKKIINPYELMEFALLDSRLAWNPSSLSSLNFSHLEREYLFYACPIIVFWKHITCLVSQVHKWRGILPHEEINVP